MGKEPISTNQAMMTVADGVIGAAVLLVLGLCLGHYLDQKLMTTPWLTIILCFLGGGAGLARLVIKAIKLNKDDIE